MNLINSQLAFYDSKNIKSISKLIGVIVLTILIIFFASNFCQLTYSKGELLKHVHYIEIV